ncbi:MAG: pilus assembly protein PilP [Wenzhouxiangella sp.]|jgi:type IV pilus assembly protein PilP|nr:pilus assembly protein PilP [Wenzhouxiangella sp.]
MTRKCLTALALATLLLAGCEKGTRDLEQWVAEQRQRPADPIEPIPPVATPEVVVYEAANLRDPFQRATVRSEEAASPTDEEDESGLRPDPNRRREFLESFPLDTLRMVGSLEIDGVLYALMRDNENVVHRVRQGNYVGRNHGLVEEVTQDQVEIRELVQDGRGAWIERRVQVALGES